MLALAVAADRDAALDELAPAAAVEAPAIAGGDTAALLEAAGAAALPHAASATSRTVLASNDRRMLNAS
ncbi:MAG: hypothetical protein JO247_23575 [Chloroflexi bacterium]|nr:hypothetical protein [Chloroflexota bacterium]